MRGIRLWARLLGLADAVMEDVTVNGTGEGAEIVLTVRRGGGFVIAVRLRPALGAV